MVGPLVVGLGVPLGVVDLADPGLVPDVLDPLKLC